MRPIELSERGRSASLSAAVVAAGESYLSEILVLFTASAVWLLCLVIVVALWALLPIAALIMTPALSLPTAALLRLAIVAARGDTPRWGHWLQEMPRCAVRKILLAGAQLAVFMLSASSLGIAGRIGGLAGVLPTLVAVYALIVSTMYALALWPIICDPRREGSLGQQLRLALAVVLSRPFQLLSLALITAMAVAASVQLIAPLLVLPSLVLLVQAHYVVSLANELSPVDD